MVGSQNASHHGFGALTLPIARGPTYRLEPLEEWQEAKKIHAYCRENDERDPSKRKTRAQIAKRFGVRNQTVCDIARRTSLEPSIDLGTLITLLPDGTDGWREQRVTMRTLPGWLPLRLDRKVYDSQWSDQSALARAYADWAEREKRAPKSGDWEHAGPEEGPEPPWPSRRTVQTQLGGWSYLRDLGRHELRARGREDLVDG